MCQRVYVSTALYFDKCASMCRQYWILSKHGVVETAGQTQLSLCFDKLSLYFDNFLVKLPLSEVPFKHYTLAPPECTWGFRCECPCEWTLVIGTHYESSWVVHVVKCHYESYTKHLYNMHSEFMPNKLGKQNDLVNYFLYKLTVPNNRHVWYDKGKRMYLKPHHSEHKIIILWLDLNSKAFSMTI